MNEYVQRRLNGLNEIYRSFNVLSVIAFIPTILFIVSDVYLTSRGRYSWLLITGPWVIVMIGYWIWRIRVFRIICGDFRERRDIEGYEKALKLDSIRTPVLSSTAAATEFFLLMGVEGAVAYAALFISWFTIQMVVVVMEVLPYWYSKRKDLKKLRS